MKLIKNNKKEKGFTLIELVVVIAILAILALILIPSLSGYKTKADRSKDEANARNLYTAATLVAEDLKFDETAITNELKNNELVDTSNIGTWSIKVDSATKKITVTVGDVTYPTDKTSTP